MRSTIVFKAIAFVLPLFIISGFLYLRYFKYEFYDFLISEDSIFEYFQAIAYFSTGVIYMLIAFKCTGETVRLQRILFITAGLGALIIAMEEISWGQRLFGINTPEWFQKHNIQNELSIHNLKPVQKIVHLLYALTGFVLSFGWISLGENFPYQKLPPGLINIVRMLKPKWFLMTYFLPLFLFYTSLLLTGSPGNYFTYNDQEVTELLLSLGLFWYSFLILGSLKRRVCDDQALFHG